MPRRNDINRIMIIGSGPIVIGQACEFDYSGTQACRVLKNEGYEVILVNSNPATIMTDVDLANKTYIEPMTLDILIKIIKKENPDAILPTLGGQTALNLMLELHKKKILEYFNIEIIGASLSSVEMAESRYKFKKAMNNIGLRIALSKEVHSVEEALLIGEKIGFPLVVRASYAMGGKGSGLVFNFSDLIKIVKIGLEISPISQVMLEESLVGWKEYELELMRDYLGNAVVVCSIENFDPIGVHTGDSITVAPIQTLTNTEFQVMRDAAIDVIRKIGINTGGANVQFAINSITGEMMVVEMNPRVSRSSALASKATGFPIAKIAAKLAVGYSLDEIKNNITKKTMACFEPSIDYCVVKIPVWDFYKFEDSRDILSTKMKSVGETMSFGRTFKESLQKAIRSLGENFYGYGYPFYFSKNVFYDPPDTYNKVNIRLKIPSSKRFFDIYYSFYYKINIGKISNLSGIDSWFLNEMNQIKKLENFLFITKKYLIKKNFFLRKKISLYKINKKEIFKIKQIGFSDIQLSFLLGVRKKYINKFRIIMNISPIYKAIDTCASEFHADSSYYYSTYDLECDLLFSNSNNKIVILGSGPNRIGQGIEFDYCCVHASEALIEENMYSILINSNPETVSTDYDISNRLYFEPLTYEDIMNVIYKEKPYGVIVQFGGQIPLNLSESLERSGINILGTKPCDIGISEDRESFLKNINKLGFYHPKSVSIRSVKEAIKASMFIGFPLIVRPSFILGGRAINIIDNSFLLEKYIKIALSVSQSHSVTIDEFLENAIEIDVDVISDGKLSVICGIIEHIENAGIHSGDSAFVFPPQRIKANFLEDITSISKIIASKFRTIGLINIQYAIKGEKLYIIEINQRASRTLPFICKATGIPFVKYAIKIMLGNSLQEIGFIKEIVPKRKFVKESVLPFDRFLDSNVFLGPTMKSTGEVMGIGENFQIAFMKAQMAVWKKFPVFGTIFLNCDYYSKKNILFLAKKFRSIGFRVVLGLKFFNISYIKEDFIEIIDHNKVLDFISKEKIEFIILIDHITKQNEFNSKILRIAIDREIPYFTTLYSAITVFDSIKFLINNSEFQVESLQEYYKNFSRIKIL